MPLRPQSSVNAPAKKMEVEGDEESEKDKDKDGKVDHQYATYYHRTNKRFTRYLKSTLRTSIITAQRARPSLPTNHQKLLEDVVPKSYEQLGPSRGANLKNSSSDVETKELMPSPDISLM